MEKSSTPQSNAGGGIPNSNNYQAMQSSPNVLGISPDDKTERENEIHKQARMNRSLSVGPG